MVTLLPSRDHVNKILPFSPSLSPHSPEDTTVVLHPLIKKGTTARVQPASQSAGYKEEQLNPPTLGLDVSVTVIAAPLGVGSLGQSRLRSNGGLPRRAVVVGLWGKSWGGGLVLATLCVS